jgi:hypothetical protein
VVVAVEKWLIHTAGSASASAGGFVPLADSFFASAGSAGDPAGPVAEIRDSLTESLISLAQSADAFVATPAVSDGKFFFRSAEHLWCGRGECEEVSARTFLVAPPSLCPFSLVLNPIITAPD